MIELIYRQMSKNKILNELQNLLDKIQESKSLIRKENKFLNKKKTKSKHDTIY